MKDAIVLVERHTTDCQRLALVRSKVVHSKDLPAFFEKWDLKRMWPGSGLADKTVGITGLRENFVRDVGIERPYWGPSKVAGTQIEIAEKRSRRPGSNKNSVTVPLSTQEYKWVPANSVRET